MIEFFQIVHQYFVIPIVVFLFVAGLFAYFWKNYWQPARKLGEQLQGSINYIEELQAKGEKNLLQFQLDQYFSATNLNHSWQMYKNTLHKIEKNNEGELELVGYRSTAPSEYFFSQSLIVDTPLHTELFKHIPSIMTGVGIIGTFGGLLLGLSQFDPAGDPSNVQNSLALLLHGVRDAFIASFAAILAAMFVTWKEKSWLRTCYAKLEELTSALDGLFESETLGVEYLEQLVKSAQESATQTKQLKDSLVSDLKAMMENLIDAQKTSQQELATQLIQSSEKNSSDMANNIGQAITDSLQTPLEKIAGSVQQISGDQSNAVQDLLTDVLTAFMNRFESTFGNQMTGMSEMMNQSISAMREMQVGFNQLISDMSNNSEASSKALEQQMLNMLTEIEQKQNEMAGTMNEMLEKVQLSVTKIGDTGEEAAQKMNSQISEMLSQINSSISTMMVDITEKRIEQDRIAANSQQSLHQNTNELVNGLSDQVDQLLKESETIIKSNRQTLEKLSEVSMSSIQGMNEGAEKMRLAADRFTSAGHSLSTVTEGSTALLTQINTVSGGLTTTTNQLRSIVSDYQQSRTSVDQAIQVLEKVIATAREEAGMNSQMLGDMQKMTQALQGVQNDMQIYLSQVNDVLASCMERFSSGVESTLNKSLSTFDNSLDLAVKRLAGGIEDLGSVTEELSEMLQRNARRS